MHVVVLVSVMAACAISNIVKSSLGPVGLDKMLVDDIGVRSSREAHGTFSQIFHDGYHSLNTDSYSAIKRYTLYSLIC